jgi:hypothetical protein
VRSQKIAIVGAMYNISTAEVEFFQSEDTGTLSKGALSPFHTVLVNKMFKKTSSFFKLFK